MITGIFSARNYELCYNRYIELVDNSQALIVTMKEMYNKYEVYFSEGLGHTKTIKDVVS